MIAQEHPATRLSRTGALDPWLIALSIESQPRFCKKCVGLLRHAGRPQAGAGRAGVVRWGRACYLLREPARSP
jgi:hypothetical protein